jgi:hypothetical protein
VRNATADLAFLPAISATYLGETLVDTSTVVAESTGQRQAMFSFFSHGAARRPTHPALPNRLDHGP